MKPYFSIIIPVYNKENHIKATLESVLNQTFKDFEIIIVNDGSTDNSENKISQISDKRIHLHSIMNHGVSYARNYGITKATSDLIAFLDADDLWKPFHLEDLKSLYESYPKCGLYCTSYETLYYGKKIVKPNFLDLDQIFLGIVPDYFASSLINSIALTSAVLIPKKMIEKHGDFNTKLRSGQDTELWIRIALKEKIAFSSNISVIRIISDLDNHLSASEKRIDRLQILYQFKDFEKTNKRFKKYMDLNRFSMAIERKINGDYQSFNKIIEDIDYINLYPKQKIILKLPTFLLKNIKHFQMFLIKNRIYLSPFR